MAPSEDIYGSCFDLSDLIDSMVCWCNDIIGWLRCQQRLIRCSFEKVIIPIKHSYNHKFTIFKRRVCSGYRSCS